MEREILILILKINLLHCLIEQSIEHFTVWAKIHKFRASPCNFSAFLKKIYVIKNFYCLFNGEANKQLKNYLKTEKTKRTKK